MKRNEFTWRTVRLVILIILLIVSLASAGNVSNKASIASDRSKPSEDRMRAILDLGASADESAASILLGILRDSSENTRIRTSAVVSLMNIGTPRAEIIKTFESVYNEANSEKNFRYTILLSFGKMKAVESLSLISAALSSEDGMIRFKAVQALGALDNEDAMQILANHLTKEEDHMVRAAAIRSAGQNQTLTAENILTKSLSSDSAPLVRNNAAIMLGKFKELRPETKAALASARDDASHTVRATVRRILP
jgi:HEAT repeat protein